MLKRFFVLLLAAVLIFGLVSGVPVFGAEQGSGVVSGFEERTVERQYGNTYAGPALGEGNHVLWIERIANLPDYAEEFYGWLVENSGAEGCLADPTRATAAGSGYVYPAGTVSSSLSYTCSNGQTPKEAAGAAAKADAALYFETAMDFLSESYSCFMRDHPEVFWLDGASCYGWNMEYRYSYGNGKGTVSYNLHLYFYLQIDTFDIRDSMYLDGNELKAAIDKRDGDIEKILEDCPVDAPVFEQVRYLNQKLTSINGYNSGYTSAATGYPWSCVSALAGSVGEDGPVCEGYSKAFKVLCDRLGIGCVLVEGDAKSSAGAKAQPHMWNYVQVDGKWYAVDVTWNDPVVVGAEIQAVSGYEREDWLLLGGDCVVSEGLTFLQSHPVDNSVTADGLCYTNGPVLSGDAYEPAENYMDMTPYRGDVYTAPEKEGCIFAGWYTDPELTKPVARNVKTGWAYAKFLDENTLTVKYQVTNGTTAQSQSTDLRLLTAVDGLNYRTVGFDVEFAGSTQTLYSSTVYEQVRSGGTLIRNAAALFGADASFFVTYTLLGVPKGAYDMRFTVTPRWQTLDGTEVTGTARSFAISDDF